MPIFTPHHFYRFHHAVGLKRKWFKGGTTKKDAERVLMEKLNEIDQGTYREMPKTTFDKFSEHWLK
jgi:hypothetical protein